MRSFFFNASVRFAAVVWVGLLAFAAASAQDSPQSSAASKTAKFGTVAKTDAAYTGAIDAHDKSGASKMIDKKGAFKGTVSKVFAPRGGNLVILNFDDNYKTAMTALAKKGAYTKFPDLEKLVDQEVDVTGNIVDITGNPEMELTDPGQIFIVK
jgi:hypothetical protein